MMKKYVIIGGGVASLGCIDGIRKKDSEGEITHDRSYHTISKIKPPQKK